MAAGKNILILSYFFPPCNKVGGRRWAKFGKYLSKDGYNVHVLSVNIPFSGKCPWEKDTASYKGNIARLPYIEHRPYYRINKSPATLVGKIRYRLSLHNEKLFSGKKDASSDISLRYGKSLLEKATQIIEKNKIQTVIVTGGPFHWCYEGLQLKKKFSELTFLLDLRDFWTGGELYTPLDKEARTEEDRKELECMKLAAYVITPAERIADFLKDKYLQFANKIIVLPHAYDGEELPSNISAQPADEQLISFAYGGIMYSKMEASVEKLINLLKELISSGKKVSLDIYTFDNTYKELFSKAGLDEVVQYHPSIAPSELFNKFLEKDYLLQLRAGESQEQHFKSTKFYELIALKKPVVYFGPEGDVSEFISSNKLGFSGNTPVKELAEALISNKKTKNVPDMDFNVSQFEFKAITRKLEEYL
jgi:glycosyltransferase involved in cell wall biosynthesis